MTTADNDKTLTGKKDTSQKRKTTDKEKLSDKKKTFDKRNIADKKKTFDKKKIADKKKTLDKKKVSDKKKARSKKKASGKKKVTTEMRKKQLRLRLTIAASAVALTLLGVFFHFSPFRNGKAVRLSDAVLQYKDQVRAACESYGIPDFSEIALAVMQQESAGSVPDVMQSSESPFNTLYPNTPGAITDPSYSIQVGIETLAYCLEEAGCKSPSDSDRLKLALQTYNYGNSYATWALENYGEYSEENAAIFSENMKAKLGWSEYGDKQYVPHVLQYYSFGF